MAQSLTINNSQRLCRAIRWSSAVSLLLGLSNPALADTRFPVSQDVFSLSHPMLQERIQAYTPSSDSQLPDSTHTAGGHRAYAPPSDSQLPESDHTGGAVRGGDTRSCGGNVAALAPRLHHNGQTLSPRPTFVWYVLQENPQPLEFHLYRYKADGQLETLLINFIGQSTQGYMAYTLPSEQPDLIVGETYLWQVALYCDDNLEEIDTWSTADIEVVAPPEQMVELPDDPLQRAQVYAQSGYWYEAIALVYDAISPEAKAFRQSLLLDLADLDMSTGEELLEGELPEKRKILIDQLIEQLQQLQEIVSTE